MSDAQISLKSSDEHPYELNPGDDHTPPDWAHRAARGVMADLTDRCGIKHALQHVRIDDRKDMVSALAEIIRQAHADSTP